MLNKKFAFRRRVEEKISIASIIIFLCFALLSGQSAQKTAAAGPGIHAVLTGDYADPTIVRVGGDFYMTHSSYTYMPGLLVWHSKDLMRWERVCHALHKLVGDVWAPDFVYDKGKFTIYFPAASTNWVVTAARPEGPWSEPVDLHLRGIDPGHIATPDGKRFLYVDSGRVVELAPDGLSVVGEPARVYDGWKYPEDWVVEGFYSESPKLIDKDGYYYLTTAQGGTAGRWYIVFHGYETGYAKGESPFGPKIKAPAVRYLKIRMVEFDLQFFYSEDGKIWKACPNSLEVSGYHQNMLGGFSSLKIGILAKGKGNVTIDDFKYRALD